MLGVGLHFKKTVGLPQWDLVHLVRPGSCPLAADKNVTERKRHLGNQCHSDLLQGCCQVWRGLCGRKPHISEWMWEAGHWSPKDVYVDICEPVSSCGKGDSADAMEL